MDPALIAMAVSALGSIAGSALKKKNSVAGTVASNAASQYAQILSNRAAQNEAINYQSKLMGMQNKMQQAFWNHTFNSQNARQDWLNRNAATIQKHSLRSAGLSAASLNDSPFGTAAASGSVGGSIPAFSPIATDLLAVKSAEAQVANLNASAEKASAEAEKTRMENANYNEWYNIQKGLAEAQTAAQNASTKYTNDKNEREWSLVKPQIVSAELQNKILSADLDFKTMQNEAMNKEYVINGKKVKGSEIPNFKELWTLEMAKETLRINWYSAVTSRMSVEGDWKRVLTNKWLVPLADQLTPVVMNEGTEIVNKIKEITGFVDGVRNDINRAGNWIGSNIEQPVKKTRDWLSKKFLHGNWHWSFD